MGWVAYHLILVRVNSSPALFITDRCVVLDRDQAQHPTSVPSLSMTFVSMSTPRMPFMPSYTSPVPRTTKQLSEECISLHAIRHILVLNTIYI